MDNFQDGPNEEIPEQDLLSFIRARQEEGVQGFIFGENHDDLSLPQMIRSHLLAMREAGIETLYVEYVPQDDQNLLDKALSGDKEAQKHLRADFERSWRHGGNESAQARYDLVMAAHAAGMRVVGIDTAFKQVHIDSSADGRRLVVGDAYMARVIRENDNGGGFAVMVGEHHTYAADQAENPALPLDTSEISPHGGLDARLNAAGIRTTSIDHDLSFNATSHFVTESDLVQQDYKLFLPQTITNHSDNSIPNMALFVHGTLNRLEKDVDYLQALATGPDVALLADAQKSLDDLRTGIEQGHSKKQMEETVDSLYASLLPAMEHHPDKDRTHRMDDHMLWLSEQVWGDEAIPAFLRLKHDATALKTPEGTQLWKKREAHDYFDTAPVLNNAFHKAANPPAAEIEMETAMTLRQKPSMSPMEP